MAFGYQCDKISRPSSRPNKSHSQSLHTIRNPSIPTSRDQIQCLYGESTEKKSLQISAPMFKKLRDTPTSISVN